MSFGDLIFGKPSKSRTGPTKGDIKKATAFITGTTGSIFEDIRSIFPQAAETRLQGQEGVLNIFRQSFPEQLKAFQLGNVGAQETQVAGLPQRIAALLGQPLDLSGLQPKSVAPDLSFITEAQLPEFNIDPAAATAPAPTPDFRFPNLGGGR